MVSRDGRYDEVEGILRHCRVEDYCIDVEGEHSRAAYTDKIGSNTAFSARIWDGKMPCLVTSDLVLEQTGHICHLIF